MTLDAVNDAIILRLMQRSDAYRACYLATLDQLHEAQRTIDQQRQDLADQRAAWARLTPEAANDE